MRARGREVYIIAAVVAVVLIVAWYFLLLSPTRSQDQRSRTRRSRPRRAALESSKAEVARLETYKKTAPQSRAEIVRLGKMLPESEGIPSLIIELTKTASASGVDLLSITRGTTTDRVAVRHPGRDSSSVSGRFFDVEDFLYRMESYVAFRNAEFRAEGRLLEVTQLTMTGGAATDRRRPPLL